MKRILVGGLLAAATLLGGLALANGSAAAVVDNENDQPKPLVCYDQEPFQEWKFKKTVTTPTYGDVIDKETRTRNWVAGIWQNFSPNDQQGEFEGPPSWPTDDRGTWQHKDPKDIPGGHQGPDGVYQKGQGNSSWFYRAAGYWGEWGPWADWGADPVNDDGRARGPLPHDSGPGWERQYRYVVVGEFQNGTTTETFFYNGGAVSTTDENIYGTNGDLDRSWIKFGERTNPGEPFEVPCPTQDPKVEKTYTEWEDGTFECDDTTVEQTRVKTITTTTYTWNGDGFDEEVAVETKTQTRTRDLTEDEIEECPDVQITPQFTYTPPTCLAAGTIVVPESDNYTAQKSEDGTWTLTANEGSTFAEGTVITIGPFELAQKAQDVCPTDVPPAVVPPAAEPPAAATPQVVVVAAGPVPPAAAPAAAPAPAQTELPSTGSSSWGLALAALASLLGGLGLMRLSRRTS
jgi:LPXTG-motif cell wall-anchored protein